MSDMETIALNNKLIECAFCGVKPIVTEDTVASGSTAFGAQFKEVYSVCCYNKDCVQFNKVSKRYNFRSWAVNNWNTKQTSCKSIINRYLQQQQKMKEKSNEQS